MSDNDSLVLVGTMQLRNGLGSGIFVEVRTDDLGHIVPTFRRDGYVVSQNAASFHLTKRGQEPMPLSIEGDNEQVMRGMAAWVNKGTHRVVRMSVYPTVLTRLGPTITAATLLRHTEDGDLARLKTVPEPLLTVTHAEIEAEQVRRAEIAAADAAADLEARRYRGRAWGLPDHNPITTRKAG